MRKDMVGHADERIFILKESPHPFSISPVNCPIAVLAIDRVTTGNEFVYGIDGHSISHWHILVKKRKPAVARIAREQT